MTSPESVYLFLGSDDSKHSDAIPADRLLNSRVYGIVQLAWHTKYSVRIGGIIRF